MIYFDSQIVDLLNGHCLLTSHNGNSPFLRLARAADRTALFALSDGSLTPHQFRQHMAQLLHWQEQGRCCWLVIEDNDVRRRMEGGKSPLQFSVLHPPSLIGSGQLICYPHGAELANLSVVAARRGQGWGSRLIAVLTAVARHWQIPYLEITVDEANPRALALYRRLGFVADRRLFLPDGRTAIILGQEITNDESRIPNG